MADVAEAENILSRLLSSDNDVIQKTMEELIVALENPRTCVSFCALIGAVDKDDKLKSFAAIILKKKLAKRSVWKTVPKGIRQQIKQFLLKTIIDEQHSNNVKKQILQLIAALAKYEVMKGTWNELFDFVDSYVKSNDENERRFGMFIIRNLTDYIPKMFEHHLSKFINYFVTILNNAKDLTSSIVYDTISSMDNIIELNDRDQELQAYSQSIPRVLEVILALSTTNPDHADDCLTFINNLTEVSIEVIMPHIKSVVQVSVQLAGNKTMDDVLRCSGINLISAVIRNENKVLVKLNLLEPIMELMFNILSAGIDNSTLCVLDLTKGYDSNPMMNAAGNCIATIADKISGYAVMPIVIKLINSAHITRDSNVFRACYMTMAFVSNKYSKCMKRSYVNKFENIIKIGLNSSDRMIKSAALYALGEVSRYVQPKFSVCASEILPELLKIFKEKLIIEYTEPECSSEMRMIFCALDKFINNMGNGIEKYIPEMVAIVLDIIKNEQCCIELKHKAITIMCSTVGSGGKSVVSYFVPVMEILNVYLTPGIEEKLVPLQIMVIKLLTEFVDVLDLNEFETYLDTCLKSGLNLLQATKENQHEVRAVCYGLFINRSISRISLNKLAPYIDIIMHYVLKSLDNCLIVNNNLSLQEKNINAYNNDDVDDDDNDESLESKDYSINSSDCDYSTCVNAEIMEEKINACLTIATFAQITGENFLPYLNKSFDVVSKLLDEDDKDIVDPALQAYGQLCINVSRSSGQTTLEKNIKKFLNFGERQILEDGLDAICVTFLEILAVMLKEIGNKMINYAQPIMVFAKEFLTLKIGDGNYLRLDDLDSEYNEWPLKYAGSIVSNLCYVIPPHVFVKYFISLAPLLNNLLAKNISDTLRIIGLTIIRESARGIGENNYELPEIMFSLVIPLVADENYTVRHDSVFTLGNIVFYGKQSVYKYYPTILNAFSQLFAEQQRSQVVDNVCGALARMIITNIEGVSPQYHAIPLMIKYLPLYDNFKENLIVFRCLVYLYEIGNQYMVSLAELVIKSSLVTLSDKRTNCDYEMKMEIVKLLHMYKRDYPDKCLELTLPEDLNILFTEIKN